MPTGQYKRTRISPVTRIMRCVTIDPVSGCWLCSLSVDAGGYSRCQGVGQSHRIVYEHHKGPIPEGLELDHVCHKPEECEGGPTCPHRRCVNPDHLEPVTKRENWMRSNGVLNNYKAAAAAKLSRTHCPNGHEYDRVYENGKKRFRFCTKCRDERAALTENRAKRRKFIHKPHANSAKTHCKRGHAFTPENTRTTLRQRTCLRCEKERRKHG